MYVLGFSSGLPYFLTSQTLQAWMNDYKVDLKRITAMSMVGLAYTLKFLWAPFLDRFTLPFLGRRRGWVIVLQLALMVAIATMSQVDPVGQPWLLAAAAVSIAFFSSSQDVVLDAYNADLLTPEQRAAGSGIYVTGYRTGMVISTVVAFTLADHISWRAVYLMMAGLMVVGVIGTFFAEEPPNTSARFSLRAAFVEMWRRFGPRRLLNLLAFAALYQFGYYFAQPAIIVFFRGLGFSKTEIGVVYKLVAFGGVAIGGAISGALVARFGLRRTLIPFGLLAALTHLLYAALALAGRDMFLFCTAVLVDNVANAMVTSATLAIFMGAVSPAASATQFAILTSLTGVGMRVFGPFAADVIHAFGYAGYFATSALVALPGLVVARSVGRET